MGRVLTVLMVWILLWAYLGWMLNGPALKWTGLIWATALHSLVSIWCRYKWFGFLMGRNRGVCCSSSDGLLLPALQHPADLQLSQSLANSGGADGIWALACRRRRRTSPSAGAHLLRDSCNVRVSPSLSASLVSECTHFFESLEFVPICISICSIRPPLWVVMRYVLQLLVLVVLVDWAYDNLSM